MSLLKNQNFVVLMVGQLVSTVGNNLFTIALPWFVYVMTNSKADLALTGFMLTLPTIVGIFAGVMVDRWRKRATMMVSDGIRTLLSLVLFISVLAHSPLWLILLLVLSLQTVGQFFNPASGALFPLLVEEKDIAGGSGLLQSSNALAQLVGTVSGGALIGALGAPILFLLDSISFIVSVISLFFIRVKESVGKPDRTDASDVAAEKAINEKGHSASFVKGFLNDWLQGLALMARSKFLILIIIAALVTNMALAPIDITLTAWVKGPMHGTAFDLGLINGGFFIGIIVGGILLGAISKRANLRTLLAIGLISIGLCTGLFGAFRSAYMETAIALVAGFAVGIMNGALSATFIKLIPESMRGRAFGLFGSLSSLATPLGMAIIGILMIHLSLQVVFLIIGTLCALSGLSMWLPIRDDKERLIEVSDPTVAVQD